MTQDVLLAQDENAKLKFGTLSKKNISKKALHNLPPPFPEKGQVVLGS
jgi:hypothetical protein